MIQFALDRTEPDNTFACIIAQKRTQARNIMQDQAIPYNKGQFGEAYWDPSDVIFKNRKKNLFIKILNLDKNSKIYQISTFDGIEWMEISLLM